MVDFVISEYPWMVSNILEHELIGKFKNKVNLEFISLIVLNQKDLEVTYSKSNNTYRFDNVSMDKLISLFNTKNNFIESTFGINFNIDIDLKNKKIIFFNVMDGLDDFLSSDINNNIKMNKINEFKEVSNNVNKLGFKLEKIDYTSSFSLVCNNPTTIDLHNLANALVLTDNFSLYDF